MDLLGVAAHPFRSVLRNRRASASALLGLLLGVAVVTAPWIALDSTVRGVLDYRLASLQVDAAGHGPPQSLSNATDALRAVPNVERVEPYIPYSAQINATLSGLSDPNYTWAQLTFVDPSFESAASRLGIEGFSVPPPGGVAIHESYRALGLAVGDIVVFEARIPVYDTNGTYLRDEVRTVRYNVSSHFGMVHGRPNIGGGIYLRLSEGPGYISGLNISGGFFFASQLVWLNRDALLDPFDVEGSMARVRRQLNLMGAAVREHGFSVSDAGLLNVLTSTESSGFALRLFFMAFAIPTLVIAGLLGKVGFDIGAATRRREFAVLRARGLSRRGVKAMLFAESGVLAAIAAVAGTLAAVVLSRFLVVSPFQGVPGLAPTDVAVSTGTVVVAFLFSLLLAFLSARGAAKWLATEDLVSPLKAYQVEEAAVPRRPSRDFLIGGIGAAGFILLLVWGSAKDSPFSVLTFLLGFSTAIMAPMAPFFLMIAVVRYLTRGTTAPYRAIARLLRRWLGDLYDLVEKNLVRAPRRSSNATAIVTLSVAFVVGVSVFSASVDAYRLENLLRFTPADVIAESPSYLPPDLRRGDAFNASNQAALRSMAGVRAVTLVLVTFPTATWGWTIVFDATTYLSTVPWVRADHLGGVSPTALMEQLRAGDAFAGNTPFQRETGLQVGDRLPLGNLLDVSFAGRLTAIVPGIPGLWNNWPGDDLHGMSTYLDIAALGPGANVSKAQGGRYLISLEPGTDRDAVKDAINDLFAGALSVRTLDDAREAESQNVVVEATFSYLHVQANVAILLLGSTVGLFVFSASAERRDEFATFIARGAGTKVVWRLLAAEGWVIAILGTILGVVAGLLTVGTFFALISSVSSSPIPYVVPARLVLLLGAVAIAVGLAVVLAATAIRRMDVARVLKLRGG